MGGSLIALGCAGRASVGGPAAAGPSNPYRLPTAVVPRRYELRLAPDLRAGRFTGEETVEVTVREQVREVILNAVQLEIRSASIQHGQGRTLKATVTPEEATERIRLDFGEALSPGVWRLSLAFAGALSQRLQGFYLSRVTGVAGEESQLAVTQFQSADARRAFPCWDEPAFKAIFEVTLVVDRRLTALSNAAVVSAADIPGTTARAVKFAPTVPMSTYLVAFVVGDLEATPPRDVDGVRVQVWSLPGRQRLAQPALDAAAFAVHFFRDYYRVPYPGDKLDLIAVPDFEAGAMENLGAVIFRETNLLVDEARATPPELRLVVDTVCHELAHMWFGDLVTMAWWNGLWLNEAFATFMQILAVDAFRPAWERWVAFAVARADAMEIDALSSARPVEYAVQTPAEAEGMFDVITYQKGGAILRMLEGHLGPEAFRQGVSAYLQRHRFGNAETRDLWTALDTAAGPPTGTEPSARTADVPRARVSIPRVMDAWVSRPGYPVVSVAVAADDRTLILSQRRFVYREGAAPAELWHIPIHLRARLGDGSVRHLRMLLSTAESRVELPAPPDFVVLNEGAVGFYRTRYAPELLARLADDLGGRLSAIERFALVDDGWAGCLAGLTRAADYLEITARLRTESDKNVWTAFIDALSALDRVVLPEDRPRLAALVRDRLRGAAEAVGWRPTPGESEARGDLRAHLLRTLGILGDDPEIQAAARRVEQWYREHPTEVHPTLAAAAIAVSAHAGGEAEYDEYLARLRAAPTPQDRSRYLFALARFRPSALVERTLRLILDGSVGRADAPYVLRSLLLSVPAREAAWRFVEEHEDVLRRTFAQSGLAAVCEGIVGLSTPLLEARVRAFFASRRRSLGVATLEQSLDKLAVAVAFREREAEAIGAYLSRFPR